MSENLNSVKWREFYFYQIFTTIQRGKRLTKQNQQKGKVPYISSSGTNNGVDNFIGNNYGVRKFKECITLANSGSVGSAFFHKYEFIGSDHITSLINKNFNKYIYLFLLPIIKRLAEKYGFNREINDPRIKREKMLLPVDSQGQPNYDFMEKFMRQIEQRQINNQLKTIKSKLTQSTQCTFDTNAIKWKEFKISDIFKVFGTTTTHPSKLQPNGTTPRITCAATNNGLDNVYANEPTENGGVLTIDSATTAYIGYQEKDFIATDHVEKVIMKNSQRMNRYVGLFIKQCIDKACIIDENMQTKKYLYGYKFSQTRIKRQIIKLPIDSNGNPHYAFMESTMRKLEQKHLRDIFDYYTNKSKS